LIANGNGENMFITVQNHIIQTEAIQHIELASAVIHMQVTGRNAFQITFATKADAESVFKRIAGTLKSENTGLRAAIGS
jgi:hypothetical protein